MLIPSRSEEIRSIFPFSHPKGHLKWTQSFLMEMHNVNPIFDTLSHLWLNLGLTCVDQVNAEFIFKSFLI